jgi:AraC family transcriptional regulator
MAALRAMRIEAAKVQLVRGDLKLDAIAIQTGFADAFHLSRTFKRMVGSSPRQFLRNLRSAGAVGGPVA